MLRKHADCWCLILFQFRKYSPLFVAFTLIQFNKLGVLATHSYFNLINFQGFQLFAAFVELALALDFHSGISAKLSQHFYIQFCLQQFLVDVFSAEVKRNAAMLFGEGATEAICCLLVCMLKALTLLQLFAFFSVFHFHYEILMPIILALFLYFECHFFDNAYVESHTDARNCQYFSGSCYISTLYCSLCKYMRTCSFQMIAVTVSCVLTVLTAVVWITRAAHVLPGMLLPTLKCIWCTVQMCAVDFFAVILI